MNRISGVLITYNEEEKVEQALSSLQEIADEILVVDSFSTDTTVEICRQFSDRILQRPWAGYRDQKQFATEQARHDWILSLDADEVLSPPLRDEIREWKKQSPQYEGYYLPRKTYFMGQWIKHTTWYPDWQLRLFQRSSGRWEGGRIHESFRVAGTTGRLKGEIYHHTYSSFSEYLDQLDRFSSLAAQDYYEEGKRAYWGHFALTPPLVFVKNYVWKLGFLDGTAGLVVSLLAATSTLLKYLKLWELQSSTKMQRRQTHEK